MLKDYLIYFFAFFLFLRQISRMTDAIVDAFLKKTSYVSAFSSIFELFALYFILKYL